MPLRPIDLYTVLGRFDQSKLNATTKNLCQQALGQMHTDNLLGASSHAQAAFRDATSRNDQLGQAVAKAYLAAVSAVWDKFNEAQQHAEDCCRLFSRMGAQQMHNATVAQTLLAVVYRMHMDKLSRDLIQSLEGSRNDTHQLQAKALSKGQIQTKQAAEYRQFFLEYGEQIRRARWITAIPYALPLVWLPAIDLNPPNSSEGYMEPVLFTLRTRQEAATEEAGDSDPGEIVDVLYTARPVPGQSETSDELLRPPRLDPGAVYIAVKIDPETAREPGFQDDDYWLLRSNDPNQLIGQIEQAGGNLAGMEFKRTDDGHFQFRFVSPKDTSGAQVPMITLTVDAILRRVP